MPRCSASGCRNMGSHTFPKDPNLRILWEKATNKENFKASKHSRLCYDHFTASDYVDTCLTTGLSPFHRYLKKTAVPSIFSTIVQRSRTRTSRTSENEAKTSRIQYLRRYLKKTAVPTVFSWKRPVVSSTTIDKEQKRSSRKQFNPTSRNYDSPKKNIILKNNTSSPKKEENNSTELDNAIRNRSVRLRNRKAYLLNRRCSVPHCNTRPTNEIKLHPCPNNAAVRNEWAEALRVSYQYVKNMVACSLHFTKIDFITSKNSERVLKYNAVPSRNLPNRKKTVMPAKHKLLKKDASAKAAGKQQTMTETVVDPTEPIEEVVVRECRACLKKLGDKTSCCDVFQAWAPPWVGMEPSIAEDLAKLANVEITPTDRHSKFLCLLCYKRLLDAATFAATVRNCDLILRMRFTSEIDIDKVWPKPIQVDKNINGSVFRNSMDIEIKQEVVSDEEYPVNGTDNPYVETELANLDIKIEPEELVEPPPMNITINGTISLNPLNSENKDIKNETELHQESQFMQMEVKQEPTSEGEQENEQTPDLSLECLLCTKSFNSVTGLKAHVIAQHSYKTVKRKADGSVSPEKKHCERHQCKICKRYFLTSTDLMVHETCHNKHACYGCTEKFDTFELLTRHRKRCKASVGNSVQKLKTLEDVKRPLREKKVEYLTMEIEKIESGITFKEEDMEIKETDPLKDEDVEMKEENSKGSLVASATNKIKHEKNQFDAGNEEVDSDKKPENVSNENTERTIGEVESNEKSENVTEEVDTDKLLESIIGIVEDGSDKKGESVVEAADNTLQSIIEEVERDSKKSSEKEDLGSEGINTENEEQVTESLKREIEEDPDSNMKLHLEIHSTENETESALSNADMPLESLENDDCT